MNNRGVFYLSFPVFLGLLALACSLGAPVAESDRVATRVAEEKAIAATLTAEASAQATTATALLPEQTGAAASPTGTPPLPTSAGTESQPSVEAPSPQPVCLVVANGLNLRSGPGTVYEPPIGAMAAGTELHPLAFSPAGFPGGQWIQVQVPATNQTGWVSAGPQFVSCNVDAASLSPGVIPPTPTLITTPTPLPAAPSATPTRQLFAAVPPEGGRSKLRGQIILPGFAPGSVKNPVTFYDRLVFAVEVYDPSTGSNQDGAGIDSVNVKITRDEDGVLVHERTEGKAAYCVFGGGEPDCNVLVFAQSGRWPETNKSVRDGSYSVAIHITAKSGDEEDWIWSFGIKRR